MAGNDLRKMIRTQGPFPIGAAVEYIVQVCEGVAEAHAHNIVHRDLKPSNLLVTKRADGSDLVKILDFGISKWTGMGDEEGELTQTGVVLGSPKYMSPEQLFGAGSVDARTDIWSIGAILYELIAGRPPYDQPSLARICADLAGNKPPPRLRDPHRGDARARSGRPALPRAHRRHSHSKCGRSGGRSAGRGGLAVCRPSPLANSFHARPLGNVRRSFLVAPTGRRNRHVYLTGFRRCLGVVPQGERSDRSAGCRGDAALLTGGSA